LLAHFIDEILFPAPDPDLSQVETADDEAGDEQELENADPPGPVEDQHNADHQQDDQGRGGNDDKYLKKFLK